MKYCRPDYYSRFSCIANKCSHNCCIGWEIDIDEDTLSCYRNIPGPLGQRLKENIRTEEGCSHFKLTKEERCPFLNQQGLCDLIINLGENSLCQICTDHPRFRSFFSDREEIGLGLCCEEAARLILSQKTPVRIITEETEEPEESLWEDEKNILSVREELTEMMQNRSLSFKERFSRMWTYSGAETPICLSHWADFFLTLERMDDRWALLLEKVRDADFPAFEKDSSFDLPFEQLCVYLLYRHLPDAMEDERLQERICFAALICFLLGAFLSHSGEKASLEELTEYARLYSGEIEYSDCNTDLILSEISRIFFHK